MHVEFGDDTNRSKKRVTKKMRENFAEDQGFAPSLGTTVPDSKAFDALETACEEIETKAQLVANQLERDDVLRLQHPTEFSAPTGVSGFYNAVKKGISALKQTNFKGLPRSDISSLESYLERLSEFKFEDKFAALLAHFTPAPGGPREVLLTGAIDDARLEIAAHTAAYHTEMGLYAQYVDRKVAANQIVEVRKTSQHNAIKQRIAENLKTEEAGLLMAEKELHAIHQSHSSKVERTGLIEKDMALVAPAFKVFLDSLANGLQSFKSGVSGKNVILGSGAYHCGGAYHVAVGGAEYLPRRYL